jgi:hypothetical protein
MGERIGWSVSATLPGGPALSFAKTIEVDAYDKIVVVAEAASGSSGSPVETRIEVQPSTDSADIRLLLITSDRYDDEKLTFTVLDANGSSPPGLYPVALSEPLLLVGGGVNLLGTTPNKLAFTNALGENKHATITVLVGRNAISS